MTTKPNIFNSRYFINEDPIIRDFHYNGLYAEFYNRGWWSRVYEYKWACDVFSYLIKEKIAYSAIDVATGHVHPLTFMLRSLGAHRVVGTDLFDLGSYQYALYLGDGVEFVKDDLLNTRITNRFDYVSCISLLEHLSPDNQKRAMENLVNYVNPSGCIILTFDMPGFEYKTNIDMYKSILSKNQFKYNAVDVEYDSVVRSINCPNASSNLRSLNLSCYRLVAWR